MRIVKIVFKIAQKPHHLLTSTLVCPSFTLVTILIQIYSFHRKTKNVQDWNLYPTLSDHESNRLLTTFVIYKLPFLYITHYHDPGDNSFNLFIKPKRCTFQHFRVNLQKAKFVLLPLNFASFSQFCLFFTQNCKNSSPRCVHEMGDICRE